MNIFPLYAHRWLQPCCQTKQTTRQRHVTGFSPLLPHCQANASFLASCTVVGSPSSIPRTLTSLISHFHFHHSPPLQPTNIIVIFAAVAIFGHLPRAFIRPAVRERLPSFAVPAPRPRKPSCCLCLFLAVSAVSLSAQPRQPHPKNFIRHPSQAQQMTCLPAVDGCGRKADCIRQSHGAHVCLVSRLSASPPYRRGLSLSSV